MKFVKKILLVLVAVFVIANFAGCGLFGDDTPDEKIEITFTGLEETYTFKTGDPFSQDILLKDVQITDQNGNSYKDKVVVNGLNAIQLNDDGTLKQSGSHTVKINVVVDGVTISTKIIKVDVEFVMEETDDIIYNGDFATGTVDPFSYTNVDGSVATMSVVSEQLVLSIEALSWQAAFPRIDYKDNVILEEGHFYEVSFDAKATTSRHVHVQVGELLDGDPWFYDQLAVQQYFLLTTEMASYSFRFAANQGQANLGKLSLLFGHGTLPEGYISEVCDVVYDNIKIVEVDSLGDDVTAPSINASNKTIFVGTEITLNSLYTVADDQDQNVDVTCVIKDENGDVVEALDTTKAGVYTIEITAVDDAKNSSSKTITLTIKEKATSEQPIANGDEAASVANGGWIEWHDQNWVGANVTVTNALVSPTELKYSYTMTGSNWFAAQLFYTDINIPAGEIKVVVDINSSVAGDMTIAGQKVSLVAGDNHVEITGATSSSGATLSMQFGVMADNTFITGGDFVFSNLTINGVSVLGGGAGFDFGFGEEKVAEVGAIFNPGVLMYWNDQNWCGSNVTVSQAHFADGAVTISYVMDGFCSFGLQLFLDDATIAVGETKEISMKINTDTAGKITISGNVVDLVVGDNDITVSITKVDGEAFLEIVFGVTSDPQSAISGGTFIISECELFDNVVQQLPEEDDDDDNQETDSIPAKGILPTELSSWVAWGDSGNTIVPTIVDGKLLLTINSQGSQANYNPQFKHEGLALKAGTGYKVELVLTSSIARSIQVMVQENGGSWAVLGQEVKALAANEEVTIAFEFVAGADYANTLFGIMLGALDGVANPEGEHVLTISSLSMTEFDPTLLTNGDEAASVANPGKWIEWHDQWWCGSNVTISQAKFDNGTLTMEYAVEGSCWFSIQLFYTDVSIPAGEITVVMDINSSVAGNITIAGQKVALVVGDNQIVINGNTSANGATLGIQLGVEADASMLGSAKLVMSNIQISEKVDDRPQIVIDGLNADLGADKTSLITDTSILLHSVKEGEEKGTYWPGGYRLFIVVDSKGKITYLCNQPDAGYGGPTATSYYCHPDYTNYESNPSLELLEGFGPWVQGGFAHTLFNVKIPEGGFAIVSHGAALTGISQVLTGGTVDFSALATINNRTALDENIRLIHENGKVLVVTVSEEEPAENSFPVLNTSKIEGAGIWLYFDNSTLGITGATEVSISAKVVGETEDSAWTAYAKEFTVTSSQIDAYDDTAKTARVYLVLDVGLPNDIAFNHIVELSVTVNGVTYTSKVVFTGNAFVSAE